MGIFICLSISKSVTRDEWKAVYDEAAKLIQKLPFAERVKKKIHDVDTVCLERTVEHNENGNKYCVMSGDYTFMKIGEEFNLGRNFFKNDEPEKKMIDAICMVPTHSFDGVERYPCHLIWEYKTQGMPYHILLLAVAALIEARLKRKAFTYGDISRDEFRKAVLIANQYLDNPIDMPDSCYMERFFNRVMDLPTSVEEKLDIIERYYIGGRTKQFGKCMYQTFSDEIIDAYWKPQFSGIEIDSYKFEDIVEKYYRYGFRMDDLTRYVVFDSDEKEKQMISYIIKKCEETDRFIQKLDEDRITYGIGVMDVECVKNIIKRFGIMENAHFRFYQPGDKIHPILMQVLGSDRKTHDFILEYEVEREQIDRLMKKDAKSRCEWISENNRYILLRDIDWDHIYTDIENNQESFERYYPFFRVEVKSPGVADTCRGLMLNDDLYRYSKELIGYVAETRK